MAYSKANEMKQLKKLSKSELLDLLERQKRLLANKAFLAKLKDKGDKIRLQIDRLEKVLQQHADIDETANLFQNLKLGRPKTQDSKDLDSDDDSPKQENGILSEKTTGQESFVDKLTQHMEPEKERPAHLLYHFRPNRDLRTTRTKDKKPDDGRPWFETAVTPPPSKFDEARLISLKDSYELTKHHEEKLKELAIIEATQQLTSNMHIKMGSSSLEKVFDTEYRDNDYEDQYLDED